MAMSASPACFNAHGVLTTPDGSFSFASPSGKSKAEIQFAKVGVVMTVVGLALIWLLSITLWPMMGVL